MLKLLVVEDNHDIAANLSDYLEAQGHAVDFAWDGIGGLHLALTEHFDVIILDINLPRMDGLTFCKKLRDEGGLRTPVLMLTARDTLDDKLAGFETGADDYLTKPFDLPEMEARVKALVRRQQPAKDEILRIADLSVDLGAHTVQRGGQTIELNPTAFKVLVQLMKAAPNVVTHAQLEEALWSDEPPESSALRAHMYALRRAVDKPFAQALISTVHGIGYRLHEPTS